MTHTMIPGLITSWSKSLLRYKSKPKVMDVFAMVAPVDNTEKVKYYLIRCTSKKMRLLEDFDDNGFIYERGSIVLK